LRLLQREQRPPLKPPPKRGQPLKTPLRTHEEIYPTYLVICTTIFAGVYLPQNYCMWWVWEWYFSWGGAMSRRPRALPTHWLLPFRLSSLGIVAHIDSAHVNFRGSGRNRSRGGGTRTRIFYGIVMGLCMGLVMCRLYLPFSLPVYAWNRHARSMQVLVLH
jgi:hypothetical protein